MADDPFDLGQIRAFEAVARTGSFTGAAKALSLAQSTVSQQVQRLEARFQRELLRRLARGVELTPLGEAMLLYARSMLTLADQARRHFSQPPLHGSLRIGVAEEFATAKLASIFSIFQKQHPNFELSFETGCLNMFEEMEAGDLDIIVAKRLPNTYLGDLLWREPLVWVGHPALVGRDGHIPLATYRAPSETRNAALAALRDAGRTWNVVMQSTGLVGLVAAAEAGLGVTVFGRHFVPPQLQELPADLGMPDLGVLEYVVARRGGLDDPTTDAFVAILRDVAVLLRGEP